MTKTELLKVIIRISNQLSDVESYLEDANSSLSIALKQIEDIPDDADEITDEATNSED